MNPLNLLGIIKGFNPWVILGVIAALSASHTYVYYLGGKHERNDQNTEKLESIQRAITQAQEIAKQDAEIVRNNVQTVEVIKNRTRTIRIKEKNHATANPLPAECVLDDERVRNINDALSGKDADPGKPDNGMPAPSKIGR